MEGIPGLACGRKKKMVRFFANRPLTFIIVGPFDFFDGEKCRIDADICLSFVVVRDQN